MVVYLQRQRRTELNTDIVSNSLVFGNKIVLTIISHALATECSLIRLTDSLPIQRL